MINGKEIIITYDFGHGVTGDIGAGKILNEETVVRTYGPKAIKKLEKRGFKCINCTPTNNDVKEMLEKYPYLKYSRSYIPSLKYRCDMANKYNAVLHLCFHANSYLSNSHGSEIEYVSEAGKNCSILMLKEIEQLGFYNRGARHRNDLYVLKHTKAVCVLLEPFFVSNQKDVELYQKNKDTLSTAIVKGVCNYLCVPFINEAADKTETTDKTALIKQAQHICNICGITDNKGNMLVEDGIMGEKTNNAFTKLTKILEMIKED